MGKPWETVRKYLDLTNLEAIQERMNRVGSVVWAVNHIGNWELTVYTVPIVRPGTHGVVYRGLPNRFIRRIPPDYSTHARYEIAKARRPGEHSVASVATGAAACRLMSSRYSYASGRR